MMEKTNSIFTRFNIKDLMYILKDGLSFRTMNLADDDICNALKYCIEKIEREVSDSVEKNKKLVDSLKEHFKVIYKVIREDFLIFNTQENYKKEILNDYLKWESFMKNEIDLIDKNYLRGKNMLIFLIEDMQERSEDDSFYVDKLEKIRSKIDDLDNVEVSDDFESFDKFEESVLKTFNQDQDCFNIMISGLYAGKNETFTLYSEKEWANIFKKYKLHKALKDDYSNDYMNFIKLKAYAYWLSFFSGKKQAMLIGN